jgi:hypothetical protein
VALLLHVMQRPRRDRLVADLVRLQEGFPGGIQVAMGIRLKRSIEDVERMFVEHELPLRMELVAELTLWRSHAEKGVELMRRGYDLMGTVIQSVSEG